MICWNGGQIEKAEGKRGRQKAMQRTFPRLRRYRHAYPPFLRLCGQPRGLTPGSGRAMLGSPCSPNLRGKKRRPACISRSGVFVCPARPLTL